MAVTYVGYKNKCLQLWSASSKVRALLPSKLDSCRRRHHPSLALAWARQGAIAELLDGVLDHVRSLFGIG